MEQGNSTEEKQLSRILIMEVAVAQSQDILLKDFEGSYRELNTILEKLTNERVSLQEKIATAEVNLAATKEKVTLQTAAARTRQEVSPIAQDEEEALRSLCDERERFVRGRMQSGSHYFFFRSDVCRYYEA